MAVNRDKPDNWKKDIAKSVDKYNQWFMEFAPITFRETRIETAKQVQSALKITGNLNQIKPEILITNPAILPILRMSTCPPIARDRLIGLAGVSPHMVLSMENDAVIPKKMQAIMLNQELEKIIGTISRMIDRDIFTWLNAGKTPTRNEKNRASTIVADRLCGAVSDPIIRNAQERRQLEVISKWLDKRGYRKISSSEYPGLLDMEPGTYIFRMNVQVNLVDGLRKVNIPIDVIVASRTKHEKELPLLIETKSAGDYTNTNKRRKEEASKMSQLQRAFGEKVPYILFLCGYFDQGYLGYEASEGIDWVWEHRIDDLEKFGL